MQTVNPTQHAPGIEDIELSIVMPCLNEADTLEVCIRKASQALHDQGVVGEVLIADNGSTDGSIEIAQRAGARVVSVQAKGYATRSEGASPLLGVASS